MRTAKASSLVPPTPLRPYPDRRGSWLGGLIKLVLWLAVGVAIAEVAIHYRDGGAFPYLHLYAPDAELGVRLMPGASQKVAFGGNPITSVRINHDGHRGAELAPAGTDDLVVVGDSQVFGLGVEEDQTFAAVLGKTLGKPVVNAGVPTYGPLEYRAVIADQLTRRHPKTVVLAISLGNDLFEIQRSNRNRHVVVDGRAMRRETAPAEITEFPGRELVIRRSHLVLALRAWLDPDPSDAPPPDVQQLPSAIEPPLGSYLRDIHQLTHGAGARLAVVLLPIDVQVSADEWKKYGAVPVDTEPGKALVAALVARCRDLGVPVLDATPVLAAAEPGAFLDKDPHMTARGHAAVAAALAHLLAELPASPAPGAPSAAPAPPAAPASPAPVEVIER
jgi:hypothetical protein